jgi:RNA polymerase sigma-70 factor (ECF subfamily)
MPPSSTEFDDPAFIERLRRGEPDAYRRLIRRFHGSLVGVAASVIGSHAQAEEVVQDAWLAVFAGIGRFEGRAAIGTWLFSIVLNRARTRRGREIRLVALPAEEDAPADAARFAADGHWLQMPRPWDELDPERLVAGRQLWDHVQAAIDRLPAGQRAVIILRDVEGNDAETACALLGISPENQRVLLHRARMRVRDAIDMLVGGEQRRPAGQVSRAARVARAPRRPVAERFAAAVDCIGRWMLPWPRPANLPARVTASTVPSRHHQGDTPWPSVRNIRAICSRRVWRFAAPSSVPNTSMARWRAPTISSPAFRS